MVEGLKYDEDKNFMYCEVCTKFNRKNPLHQNKECRNQMTIGQHSDEDHSEEIYKCSRQRCISSSEMRSLALCREYPTLEIQKFAHNQLLK